jgi:Protein of unknown function (DUF2591)
MPKVSELQGAQLDAAVARALNYRWSYTDPQHAHAIELRDDPVVGKRYCIGTVPFQPSQRWELGGPIIERERISVASGGVNALWQAWRSHGGIGYDHIEWGPTPLTAAMRAFAASKLGVDVEANVP